MIDSVEGLLEVNKNTDSVITFVDFIFYLFRHAKQSMVGGMFLSEAKLQFVDAIMQFKKWIKPFKHDFLNNFC